MVSIVCVCVRKLTGKITCRFFCCLVGLARTSRQVDIEAAGGEEAFRLSLKDHVLSSWLCHVRVLAGETRFTNQLCSSFRLAYLCSSSRRVDPKRHLCSRLWRAVPTDLLFVTFACVRERVGHQAFRAGDKSTLFGMAALRPRTPIASVKPPHGNIEIC